MSKTLSQNFKESEGFDCSNYLCHQLQWPASESFYEVDRNTANYKNISQSFDRQATENVEATIAKWNTVPCEENNAVPKDKTMGMFLNDHYYESEWNALLQWMDEGEIIVPNPSQFADKREEIQRVSQLADDALSKEANCDDTGWYNTGFGSSSCEDWAEEIADKGIETACQAMTPGGLKNFIDKQLEGFGEQEFKEDRKDCVIQKRRLCRHFAKGFCIRGESCDFLHDVSIFCSDEQKVFLGGLPLHLTTDLLKLKLEEQGLTVLNKPRVMRGFTPQVCLGSVKEAEKLIAQRYIFIGEHRVDVRPFQHKDQLRKLFPSVVKRSVFLGGLSEDTTREMIVNDLQRLDSKVVDCPVIKSGYAPRVVLENVEQAKMLIELKRVMVNGNVVDVRPYVNFMKRY